MSRSNKFTTVSAAKRLMESMEVAINNMIEEVKKPVDPDAGGSARKAELQSSQIFTTSGSRSTRAMNPSPLATSSSSAVPGADEIASTSPSSVS